MKTVSYEHSDDGYLEKRYAIADDSGKIIDNAQGWGYKTEQKANKAMWYKFKGGKQKIQSETDKRRAFFRNHKGLEQFINEIFENNFKEIARGEVTDEDILHEIKEKFGTDMPKQYLHD